MIRLSVLDQSPVSEGSTPAEALRQTVRLAQEAEKLGYFRFWAAEHHGSAGLAGSSPEVLAAHLAAVTSTIRVGSGGVLLPHYSPYKVAESFRVLEALSPGRIDLGIGRSSGGSALAVRALQEHKREASGSFEEQLEDLSAYLREGAAGHHRFAGLQAMPAVSSAPELWLLGSSRESALTAARLGLGLAFALFIRPEAADEALKAYREAFRPSPWASHPRSLLALFAVCAGTEEEAERLAAGADLSAVLLAKRHVSSPTLSPEQAKAYPLTPYDRQVIAENRKGMLVVTPDQVRRKLQGLCERYSCNEVMIGTITHSFEDKLESYRLIAEAFGSTVQSV